MKRRDGIKENGKNLTGFADSIVGLPFHNLVLNFLLDTQPVHNKMDVHSWKWKLKACTSLRWTTRKSVDMRRYKFKVAKIKKKKVPFLFLYSSWKVMDLQSKMLQRAIKTSKHFSQACLTLTLPPTKAPLPTSSIFNIG